MSKDRYVWVVQDPQNPSISNIELFTTRKAVIDFVKTEFCGAPIKFIWNTGKTYGSVLSKKDNGEWDDMNPLYDIGKVIVNVARKK